MTPAEAIATSVPAPMAMPTSAGGQRGRIVDAVADHRHRQAFALQLGDLGGLVLGPHTSENAVDAQLEAADGVGHRRRRRQ